MSITWMTEQNIFENKAYAAFESAILNEGHNLIHWSDWYTISDNIPNFLKFTNNKIIFHGSLGTAHHISKYWILTPGTFGSLKIFDCSAYYPSTAAWRLSDMYISSTVGDICENVNSAKKTLSELGNPTHVFIRPDSPLKQFSGRVVKVGEITLEALDFGFYYKNKNLPIIISTVKNVKREWRFVVVNKKLVAGGEYLAATRAGSAGEIPQNVSKYAQMIADEIPLHTQVYILDICDSDDGLRLLELNPFSGGDLYNLDPVAIVRAVSRAAEIS